MPSIFDRLGGHDAVNLAVDRLYARLLEDAELAPYFAGRDVDRLARHMRSFLAAAVGGPGLYRGRNIQAAHAGLRISAAHFDRTVGHVVAVLRELGVDGSLIGEIGATLTPLRALVVEAPARSLAA
jgi:hemoglobin